MKKKKKEKKMKNCYGLKSKATVGRLLTADKLSEILQYMQQMQCCKFIFYSIKFKSPGYMNCAQASC